MNCEGIIRPHYSVRDGAGQPSRKRWDLRGRYSDERLGHFVAVASTIACSIRRWCLKSYRSPAFTSLSAYAQWLAQGSAFGNETLPPPDDRVVPGHSFKYAAALQAANIGDKPHLIRIETRAGHGSGKPTEKQIEENADMWAFIGFHTGLTRPDK